MGKLLGSVLIAALLATPALAAPQTFTLIPERAQGEVVLAPMAIPGGVPRDIVIRCPSTVFGSNQTLSMHMLIEESFDGGTTWRTSSGFPITFFGGFPSAKNPSGLIELVTGFDGTARLLRGTISPLVNGLPGSYDWGLTATLQ